MTTIEPTNYLNSLATNADGPDLSQAELSLVVESLTLLVNKLEEYGSEINEVHQEALERILVKLTCLAARKDTGRWAFDLATGCGKSLSVACWIATAHRLEMGYSVLIAAEQVEGLCQLMRDLIQLGVPEEEIGLLHSKSYRQDKVQAARAGEEVQFASERRCNPDDLTYRRYVLVTHERLRNPLHLDAYNLYGFERNERDVVVWDEALLSTEASVVRLEDVESAIGWLRPKLSKLSKHSEGLRAANRWLKSALNASKRALGQNKSKPKQIELPTLSLEDAGRYDAAFGMVIERISEPPSLTQCRELLKMGERGETVRVARVIDDGLVLTTNVSVPDELKRMVVLDASFKIHALEQLDPTLNIDPEFNGQVKRYDNVELFVWESPAGKGAMSEQFGPRSDGKTGREIVEVLAGLPDDEAALVFCHKKHPGAKGKNIDVRAKLGRQIKEAGLSPDDEITVTSHEGEKQRKKYPIMTWGAADTATNQFAYCSTAVFVSVLFRSPADIFGAAVGQQRDLGATVVNLPDMITDLASHSIYQAASRTCTRITRDGQALPAKLYLRAAQPKLKRILKNLKTMMPGIKIKDWPLKHHKEEQAQSKRLMELLKRYLDELPHDCMKITRRKLWKDLGESAACPKLRSRVIGRLLEEAEVMWVPTGHSLIRTEF